MLVCGQASHEMLPSVARSIRGVVVDGNGRPIPDVSVDHSGSSRQIPVTDAGGKFQLRTTAPALVLRKPGYRGYFIRTETATNVQVVLERTEPPRGITVCSSQGSYESIKGWDARFCFPRIPGVKPSRQRRDIDYGFRSYSVRGRTGSIGIGHGSGPMWSLGIPIDAEVWESVEYEGATYMLGKFQLVDARGRTAQGKRWRYVGELGESASYSNADDTTARTLDRVFDGMCIRQ
jgi:hypothetical protein